MARCSRGCKDLDGKPRAERRPSAVVPVVLVYPSGIAEARPEEVILDLPLCRPCAAGLTVEELIGEARSLGGFGGRGFRLSPDPARTRLIFLSETDPKVVRFRSERTVKREIEIGGGR